MTTIDTDHNRAHPVAPTPGLFDGIVESLLAEHPDDEPRRMLQSPGLRTSGRFYALRRAPTSSSNCPPSASLR